MILMSHYSVLFLPIGVFSYASIFFIILLSFISFLISHDRDTHNPLDRRGTSTVEEVVFPLEFSPNLLLNVRFLRNPYGFYR